MSASMLSSLSAELILAAVAIAIYVAGAFWTAPSLGLDRGGRRRGRHGGDGRQHAGLDGPAGPGLAGAVSSAPDALANFRPLAALGAGLLLVLTGSRPPGDPRRAGGISARWSWQSWAR